MNYGFSSQSSPLGLLLTTTLLVIAHPPVLASHSLQPRTDVLSRESLLASLPSEEDTIDIGQVDLTPQAQIFSGVVGQFSPEDYYRFSLQAPSTVTVQLNRLSSGANLFLGDSQGNLLEKSSNPGTREEQIQLDLEPGTYYLLVRAGTSQTTSYTLTLQAQFIVYETVVSRVNDRNINMADPEFDVVGQQVTWQNDQGRLLVAPIDELGNFLLEQTEVIDEDLAPIAPVQIGKGGTAQGPEWVYRNGPSEIIYTKLIDGQFYIGRARRVNTEWIPEVLPGSQFGHAPVGTLNPGDTEPLIRYFLGTPSQQRQAIAWGELDNLNNGGLLPGTQTGDEPPSASRWVAGERALLFIAPSSAGGRQVFRFDVNTEEATQLTFSNTEKLYTFTWNAPEYNNELLFLTIEVEEIETDDDTREIYKIGIYRKINDVWELVHTLIPPSELPVIISAEPFVYGDRSYISFYTESIEGPQQTEIWLANIDFQNQLYRQLSDPNTQAIRLDPEPLVTEAGAFIYYTLRPGGIIYRASTGLTSNN